MEALEKYLEFIPHPMSIHTDEGNVLIEKDGNTYACFDGGFTTDDKGVHGNFELQEK